MKKVSKQSTPQVGEKNIIPLTTKEMQETGITATLNQNDVVEVVANEVYQRKMKRLEELAERAKELSKYISDVKNGYGEEVLEKVKKIIPGNNWTHTQSVFLRKKGSPDNPDFDHRRKIIISALMPYIDDRNKKAVVKLNYLEVSYYNMPVIEYEVVIEVEVNGGTKNSTKGGLKYSESLKTEMSFSQRFHYPIKDYKNLIEEIEAHNIEVAEFMEKEIGKDGVLDVEVLTKQVRVKVNKKLISQQSPVVVAHIKEMFDIDLEQVTTKKIS